MIVTLWIVIEIHLCTMYSRYIAVSLSTTPTKDTPQQPMGVCYEGSFVGSKFGTMACMWSRGIVCHGRPTRYVKLRVAHAPGMLGTFSPSSSYCVTHVPWCMLGSLTRGGGENVPGIPGACAIRHFTYLVRGPCKILFDPVFAFAFVELYASLCFIGQRYIKSKVCWKYYPHADHRLLDIKYYTF